MTKELLESLPLEEVKKRTILQQQVRAASTLPLPSHFIPPFVGAASPSLTRHTSALEKPWCISQKRPNSITPCCEGAPTAGACALHAASPTLRRIKRCRLAKVQFLNRFFQRPSSRSKIRSCRIFFGRGARGSGSSLQLKPRLLRLFKYQPRCLLCRNNNATFPPFSGISCRRRFVGRSRRSRAPERRRSTAEEAREGASRREAVRASGCD